MSIQKRVLKAELALKVIDEQDISVALELIRDIGQYQNVIYHLAFRTNSPTDMPFLKSTYPHSWLGRYLQKQYHDIDPVILEDADWKKKIASERQTLEQIADILHRKAILTVYGSEEGPSLSPREIESLYCTAKGKDCATVAEILGISEFTVRDYLKTARHKLGCHSIAQTIHEATKRRLITF